MPDKICDVSGCNGESFRTVPSELAEKVFSLKEKKTKVHLCREHYKKYKKETKKDRELGRMDWV
ncbi:hypothetical protein GCM10007108_04620 [Thermogymnomonas acidicola]|uniref:Uncharacterized protein n=1 Tax=Thermogymnomonas acidicola TaxID=399579 RepID=A0AA37F9I2_9ARCH|nr:hypothetical protein [Thermogymnomonas acidicola]GGM69596.1 hypothetical protein GCM10007108_04620 [Thermogymnomonas acidicola]